MAGQSVRDIRRRIQSVQNTQQITKAMEMVAAAKLRRAQGRVISARPFSAKLSEVLGRLVAAERAKVAAGKPAGFSASSRGLVEKREPVRKVGYVIITADRGLAGGYNANLIRKAEIVLASEERPVGLIAVGRKGRDFFRKRGRKFDREWIGLGEEIELGTAREISRTLREFYLDGIYDEVHLIYTRFISAVSQHPVQVRLLPIVEPGAEEPGREGPGAVEYIYEPSSAEVLEILLPRYIDTIVYAALLEAKASEQGARMTAMRNASDNAEEMIQELTLSYNRARQAGITKELTEITGGVEALKSS